MFFKSALCLHLSKYFVSQLLWFKRYSSTLTEFILCWSLQTFQCLCFIVLNYHLPFFQDQTYCFPSFINQFDKFARSSFKGWGHNKEQNRQKPLLPWRLNSSTMLYVWGTKDWSDVIYTRTTIYPSSWFLINHSDQLILFEVFSWNIYFSSI